MIEKAEKKIRAMLLALPFLLGYSVIVILKVVLA